MTGETFNLKSRMDQMMSDWTDEERRGFLNSLVDGLELPKIVNAAVPSLIAENDTLKARIAAAEVIIRDHLTPDDAPARFIGVPTQAIGRALLRTLNPDALEYP